MSTHAMRCVGVGTAGAAHGGFALAPTFTDTNDFWVTCDIRVPASFITYRFANSGEIAYVMDFYQDSDSFSVSFQFQSDDGTTGHLEMDGDTGDAGAFVADTWYTLEVHIVRDSGDDSVAVDVYVDGDLNQSYATTYTSPYDTADFGFNGLTSEDADQVIDFDNIKIGSSRAGVDIFEADFETLTIVPPFDSIIDTSGTGDSIFIIETEGPPEPNAPEGVAIAFDSLGPLDAAPIWTRVDTESRVAGYLIRRGRQDEFDRTGTGTATVFANDVDGYFDPANPDSPIAADGWLDGKQLAIALYNPVTDAWSTIFRGLVDDYQFDVDVSQEASKVTITAVDGLDYLAGFELRAAPFGEFPIDGDPVPKVSEGNIYYGPTPEDTVDKRINDVLDDVDWPSVVAGLREVFTGNVRLQGTVYSPGTTALTVIDEAADAEFPGIANRFIAKDGTFVFHGRLARFNPTDPQYDITTWKVGDGAAIADDDTYTQMRGLTYSRPRNKVINSSLFTPMGIRDEFIADQLVQDPASQTTYGLRSLTAENLRLGESVLTGNTAAEECVLFADYYVTTYAEPATRVNQIVFKSIHPDDPRAANVWALLCGIDISDRIQLKCNTAGGLFDDEFFYVEGLTYEIGPLNPEFQAVTLTLDLSPGTYFPEDFPWTDE